MGRRAFEHKLWILEQRVFRLDSVTRRVEAGAMFVEQKLREAETLIGDRTGSTPGPPCGDVPLPEADLLLTFDYHKSSGFDCNFATFSETLVYNLNPAAPAWVWTGAIPFMAIRPDFFQSWDYHSFALVCEGGAPVFKWLIRMPSTSGATGPGFNLCFPVTVDSESPLSLSIGDVPTHYQGLASAPTGSGVATGIVCSGATNGDTINVNHNYGPSCVLDPVHTLIGIDPPFNRTGMTITPA